MAGLDGVENKIHPGEAATKDLYHLPPEEDAKIPTVCHSLDQALDYLDKGRAFLTKGGVFTDTMIDAYIELKMQEVTRFRMTTHPIEFDMYYSAVCAPDESADASAAFALPTAGAADNAASFRPLVSLLARLCVSRVGFRRPSYASSERSERPRARRFAILAERRLASCVAQPRRHLLPVPRQRVHEHDQRQGGRGQGLQAQGRRITIDQGDRPRRGPGGHGAARRPGPIARVDPAAQRARDSDARQILEAELKTEEDRLAAMQKEFNNGEPERQGNERNFQKYLDRVAEMRAAIARKESDIAAHPARAGQAAAEVKRPTQRPPGARCDRGTAAFAALDLLATMVAIVNRKGQCVFANAAFENVLGLSRRSVLRGSVFDWFVDAQVLRDTVAAVSRNDFSTSRLEARAAPPGAGTASRCRCM